MSQPAWLFTSAPDFFNADIADLSGGLDGEIAALFDAGYADAIQTAPGYAPNLSTGMTVEVAQAYLDITTLMQSIDGDSELFTAAGDLIGGRFPRHMEDTRAMFATLGDTDTDVIYRAATTFLDWWREILLQGGFDTVLGAVGDHDIGDNPWTVGRPAADHVGAFKEAFGTSMVDSLGLPATWNGVSTTAPEDGAGQYDETAHLYQHKNVLFVQIDVFRYEGPTVGLDGTNETVLPQVAQSQLDWLSDVLTAANGDASVDHVIIQGHTPVLGPVNIRRSSGLTLEEGEDSPFFETIAPFGTNMGGKLRAYFTGEVHASTVTTHEASGIVQIAHGKSGRVDPKFMTFEVTPTSLRGTQHEIKTEVDTDQPIWSPGPVKYGSEAIRSVNESTGTVLIDISGPQVVVEVTGTLDGWKGSAIDRTVGGTQNDSYTDMPDNDGEIFGLGGNDDLTGLEGNDLLDGGDGDDILNGGTGNDHLIGGANTAAGDWATYKDATGAVKVTLNGGKASGPDGFDRLEGIENLRGSDYSDRLTGDAGDNRLEGGRGSDIITGKGGNDTYLGGNGADKLRGDVGIDVMYGGAGRDILRANAGDDVLYGEAGIDRLFGGTGNDILYGGEEDDHMEGNTNRDTLFGGNGDDKLLGGNGMDTLSGDAGDDRLLGGTGRDVLTGGTGADTLIGGGSDELGDGAADTFVFAPGDGRDKIRDFEAGVDLIDLQAFGFADYALDVDPLLRDLTSGLRIEFGGDDIVFLTGLHKSDLDSDDFLI